MKTSTANQNNSQQSNSKSAKQLLGNLISKFNSLKQKKKSDANNRKRYALKNNIIKGVHKEVDLKEADRGQTATKR